MTQPSLNQTFDTSLIDLGPQQPPSDSFSTSSSTLPSDGGQPTGSNTGTHDAQSAPRMGIPSTLAVSSPTALPTSDFTNDRGIPTHYLPTATAYDEWAEVYDNDGNILQAIDDLELKSFLPELQRLVSAASDNAAAAARDTLQLVDLGCGTGRNTAKLLQLQWPAQQVQLTGYDVSRGMLDVAQTKLDALYRSLGSPAGVSYQLVQHDFLNEADATGPPTFPAALEGNRVRIGADALVSTLVLEHFPLRPFFQVVCGLLRVGGVALVTNMHEDMGRVSQAGFERRDEATGAVIKVRGCSWAHGGSEAVAAAEAEGLEAVNVDGEGFKETAVDAGMVEDGTVSSRGKKWIGRKVWYGMLLRRVR